MALEYGKRWVFTEMEKKKRSKNKNGSGNIKKLSNGKYKIIMCVGKDDKGKYIRRSKVVKNEEELKEYIEKFGIERNSRKLFKQLKECN